MQCALQRHTWDFKMVWKKVDVLRIAVTGALLSVAVTFGSLSYFILSGYEYQSAVKDYHNIARYAFGNLAHGLSQKKEVVLAMAKHMAYFNPNQTAWPNVVWPGFYDSSDAQGKGAGLDDMFFLPLVHPHRLSGFENFMYDYFASEPAIGPSGGSPDVPGVWSLGPNGTYHDTTGEALMYDSPNNFLTPMVQNSLAEYITPQDLGINLHSVSEFGHAMDAIYECGYVHNYTAAASHCMNVTEFITFPIGAAFEDVEDFHTAILYPIYLNKNTSEVFGFIGGGFNWVHLMSGLTSEDTVGIIVTVRNNELTLNFNVDYGVAEFSGYGDQRDDRKESLAESFTILPGPDGTETSSTYVITLYPRPSFFESYSSANPVIAAITSALLIGLCGATFFLYDYYVRGESEASAAVLETKRLFVRFISHEVRSPLNAVHLGLEALTAELQKFLDLVRGSPHELINMFDTALLSWLELSAEMMSNSSAAEDVLDDLLNYDKIEMGTLRLEFSAVPIVDVVKTATAVFQASVKVKNIHLSFQNSITTEHDDERELNDMEEAEQRGLGPYLVVGDSARLAQVMRNLLFNALKFTPANGTIAVRVDHSSGGLPYVGIQPSDVVKNFEQPRAGSIRISVTDSGVGLTVEQLAQICSEGVQFNANELQAGKGSGLGLFITKGIVEQHGGILTVASAGLDHGTTFTVELPLYGGKSSVAVRNRTRSFTRNLDSKVLPGASPKRYMHQAVTVGSQPASVTAVVGSISVLRRVPIITERLSKRILVVDDVLSNRKMLVRVLTLKGYVCEQAEDGQHALDVYRASLASGLSFDAITMDFEMPVMNGPTATGHLRAMGCTVPIIGVTGNMLPDDIQFFMAQGATEVMGKPLNLSRFQELV